MSGIVHSVSGDRIVTITLDSPANRNALSRRLVAQLRDSLAAPATAGTAHAVLLTHTGTTFCSGAALDEMRDGDPRTGRGPCWPCSGSCSPCRFRSSPG